MAYKNYQDQLKHNKLYWSKYYLKNKSKILRKNRLWSKNNPSKRREYKLAKKQELNLKTLTK